MVHSQYHRNPPAGLATKERRCPGRKIKRDVKGDVERVREREQKKEGKWRGCVYSYFAYFATSSSKATSCLQHIWEWEWKLKSSSCSSQSPQTHFADSFFFSLLFPFSPLPLPLSSLRLLAHKTLQLLSSWPLLDISFTSFVFLVWNKTLHPFLSCTFPSFNWINVNEKYNISHIITPNEKQQN